MFHSLDIIDTHLPIPETIDDVGNVWLGPAHFNHCRCSGKGRIGTENSKQEGPLHELLAMLLNQFCCLCINGHLSLRFHGWHCTWSIGDWKMIFIIVIFIVINNLITMFVINRMGPLPPLNLGPFCCNSMSCTSGVSAWWFFWLRDGGEQVLLRSVTPHCSKGQMARWSTRVEMVGYGAATPHQFSGFSWQQRTTTSTPTGTGGGMIQLGTSAPVAWQRDTWLATMLVAASETRSSCGWREHGNIMGHKIDFMGGDVDFTWQPALKLILHM